MQPAEHAIAAVGGELRGKVGPVVFSRNTHGPYYYTWQPRTDPNTPPQSRIRGALSGIGPYWAYQTPAYRSAWEDYAANVLTINRIGLRTHCSGFNHFIAALSFRIYTSLTGAVWPPTLFSRSRIGPLTYLPLGIGYATARFDLTDPWRTQDGGGIAIFQSRPQTPGVNHFTGPFQYVAHSHGSSSTPPVLTGINLVFLPTPSKPYIFFRARAIEADNRLSPPLIQRLYFP